MKKLSLILISVIFFGCASMFEGLDDIYKPPSMRSTNRNVISLQEPILIEHIPLEISSMKGTPTTVNTMSGYSFDAILILSNTYENLRIARDNNGNYILYGTVQTRGTLTYPGSFIIYIDNIRNAIINESYEYNLIDTRYNGNNFDYIWNFACILNRELIIKMLNAKTISFRCVNTRNLSLMSQESGADIYLILDKLKEFISK